MTPHAAEADALVDAACEAPNISVDPRLELVARITSTPPFQKATKLQALLRFIVEQSLRQDSDEISEERIGLEVFGKGRDYSPLLDSSVRVQVRQLRLKLHEYFDGPGRDEPVILEIPKGSYRPMFRRVLGDVRRETSEAIRLQMTPVQWPGVVEQQLGQAPGSRLPYIAAGILGLAAVILATLLTLDKTKKTPWPLSSVLNPSESTELVLADSAYQISVTASGRSLSLNEYLRTAPRNDTPINLSDPADSRLDHALNGGTFTSFSDVAVVQAVTSVAARYGLRLDVKSARDVDPREFDRGNFIISGSPSSNPWASLYESKLNFQEAPDPLHPGSNLFVNVRPQNGEPKTFEGTYSADAIRYDYIDLAVVRGISGHGGSVMLIQGLRHEGKEAAARLLSDSNAAALLIAAFKAKGMDPKPRYFEAILTARSIAGIPQVTAVAAIRVPSD